MRAVIGGVVYHGVCSLAMWYIICKHLQVSNGAELLVCCVSPSYKFVDSRSALLLLWFCAPSDPCSGHPLTWHPDASFAVLVGRRSANG